MTIERITTLVKIYKVDDKNQTKNHRRYHNGQPNAEIRYTNGVYSFLPFIYSGATVSLTGDNVTAELTLSSNDIARSKVANLVNQNYRATVLVCRMDEEFKKVIGVLSKEEWLISSAAYDATAITIELSSGLDAVNANTPRRVLVSADVGPLPITGRVRL